MSTGGQVEGWWPGLARGQEQEEQEGQEEEGQALGDPTFGIGVQSVMVPVSVFSSLYHLDC